MATILHLERGRAARIALPGDRTQPLFGYASIAAALVCGVLIGGLLSRFGMAMPCR